VGGGGAVVIITRDIELSRRTLLITGQIYGFLTIMFFFKSVTEFQKYSKIIFLAKLKLKGF